MQIARGYLQNAFQNVLYSLEEESSRYFYLLFPLLYFNVDVSQIRIIGYILAFVLGRSSRLSNPDSYIWEKYSWLISPAETGIIVQKIRELNIAIYCFRRDTIRV